jgi:hypothetical protein
MKENESVENELIKQDLSHTEWREYSWSFVLDGIVRERICRIVNPINLYLKKGGSTHRVIDGEGIGYCVPAPGFFGCVIKWKPKDPNVPVKF